MVTLAMVRPRASRDRSPSEQSTEMAKAKTSSAASRRFPRFPRRPMARNNDSRNPHPTTQPQPSRQRRMLPLLKRATPPPAVVANGTIEGEYHGDSRSAEEDDRSSLVRLTTVFVERPVENAKNDKPKRNPSIIKENGTSDALNRDYNCAPTAILQHSYLEYFCGDGTAGIHSFSEECLTPNGRILPDDPTVQESIECVFASQLEEGLPLWDEDSPVPKNLGEDELISPAALMQSRQRHRSSDNTTGRSWQQRMKRSSSYQTASLVHIGTYEPKRQSEAHALDHSGHHNPSCCSCRRRPSSRTAIPLNPKEWPQSPMLLRATPESGTVVKGVRFCGSSDYLWKPGDSGSWATELNKRWRKSQTVASDHFPLCASCAMLPINNGNESLGKSLVVDFESDLFDGTLLLRIRYCNGTSEEPYSDKTGYFAGMNRRYQAVLQGRFKEVIPFTDFLTGFQLERPCGKLPPKWILKGGVKVLSFFAPQLQAQLEVQQPYCVTPLGSTPQTLMVTDPGMAPSMETPLFEPTDDGTTLLGRASPSSSALHRGRFRKKAFDKMFVNKNKDICTDPNKVYTFEFLQHLFNFNEFSIELGSMLGSVKLKEILSGQPLQIMAVHSEKRLWSFDIWHECLFEDAKKHAADTLC